MIRLFTSKKEIGKKKKEKEKVGKKEVGSVHYDISTVQYSRPAFRPPLHLTIDMRPKPQIYGIDSIDGFEICNYSDEPLVEIRRASEVNEGSKVKTQC